MLPHLRQVTQQCRTRVHIGTAATWGIASVASPSAAGATSGDISEPVADFGSWTATDSAYLFSSLARARQFVIRAPSADSLSTYQRLVDHAESGVVRSSFRRTPPSQTIVGVWRADGSYEHR